MTIEVGQPAPAFEQTAHDGSVVRVTPGQLRERVLVLYFYPQDNTPGCTAEACGFRDAFEDFADAGAEVVGVSPNTLEEHRKFAEGQRLPFQLLSDAEGTLRRAYKVQATLGLFPGRVTFVIDRRGTVRHVFNSQLRARKHVDEALRIVQELAAAE